MDIKPIRTDDKIVIKAYRNGNLLMPPEDRTVLRNESIRARQLENKFSQQHPTDLIVVVVEVPNNNRYHGQVTGMGPRGVKVRPQHNSRWVPVGRY